MNRRDFLGSILGFSTAFLFCKPISMLAEEKDTTAEVFSNLISTASKQKWQVLPIGDLISRIAFEFLDTPYVGGRLDVNSKEEKTIVNLVELDCVTLFESSLSIARCIKKRHFRFTDLVDEITYLRYRDGILIDYTSRLHYTSDWILDNVKKGVVRDITEELGGEAIQFNLNYMSQNPQNYPALKAHPEYVAKIHNIEQNLNSKTFHIIPPKNISKISKDINDGDIIAIATSSAGLDYSHTGLAFNGKLLHASSKAKKVVIGKLLADYVKSNSKSIGISVLRPMEI